MLTEEEISNFKNVVQIIRGNASKIDSRLYSNLEKTEMISRVGIAVLTNVELFEKILQELPKLKTAFDLLYDTRFTSSGTSQFHEKVMALIGDYEPGE